MIRGRLSARQVDVVLELLVVTALATGLSSWIVGTGWSRWFTALHAITGLTLVALAPAKATGSVRAGLRRRRPTRWLSVALGGLTATTITLGVLHATGLWFGVGEWSALWTHVLAAAVVAGLLLWHVASRPSRPRLADLDRRAVLQTGFATVAAAGIYGAQELTTRAFGLAGGDRRFTGSHEVGSFDPSRLPVVSWINDRAPDDTTSSGWPLRIGGEPVEVATLARWTRSVVGTIDCTGGWWSEQSWDAVALDDVFGRLGLDRSARSIKIRAATGYQRLLPFGDRHHLYLATGYGGEPLRPGHGAPIRLVAPGRRGPWWVKWVTDVDLDDRPWWWQLPLPLD